MLEFILGTMIFVIAVTVCIGIFMSRIKTGTKSAGTVKTALKFNMGLMAALVLTASVFLFSGAVINSKAADNDAAAVSQAEADASENTEETDESSSDGLAYIAAALSTGLATIGAGVAVAVAGSAALGAISEDSKLLGKTLIFVGLAEGIAIYGLIISIMILNKV